MENKKKPKTGKAVVSPELVSYSRAGDTFHYRWAARRCLRLIDFNSELKQITIEGSKEPKLGGEYVIDIAEYSADASDLESVSYFQLKHSVTQLNNNFTLSGLRETIEGFANRYTNLQNAQHKFDKINFMVVTNRPISPNLRKSIISLAEGRSGGVAFDKTIKAYTNLSGTSLSTFCSYLQFVDGEGDYDAQKYELHQELTRLTCDAEDTKPLLDLVELVRSRIEPKSTKNYIDKNDVLEQFGQTSEHGLFPAPPLFEQLESPINREQHNDIYRYIKDLQSSFLILTAEAGRGKSITCQQLVDRFGNGSLALAYDCFGNGGYRKLSAHRHRIRDAYVQISNQLAQQGLCEPMIPVSRDQDDRLTQAFLQRLSKAVGKLRTTNEDALLVILFDAVDNAEMAAHDSGDRCFANHLLREQLPEGCKVIFLSRPERVHLFSPPQSIPQKNIEPFNPTESLQLLRSKYPGASLQDAIEFCRLTDGNPRVQANSLALGIESIEETLAHLGAGCNTVDSLIAEQLNSAIAKVKALYPQKFEQHVVDICTGLATLPPFVPLELLAVVSDTEVSAVKSFVADLGRPLWLTDNYVQFRDEPTEEWFTKTFAATSNQIKAYINRLEPLADEFSYVAEALPSLLLKSGQYSALIALALSDSRLPTENPVDARNIQIYRLQFAFKAALKNNQLSDACKLALRAGEEVAGGARQLEILSKNTDLGTRFLSPQRVMELAHQRNMSGAWRGSETLYSSALLSSIPECEGEARSYLRSGWHWLHRYFEERNKEETNNHFDDRLEDDDVLVMLFSHYQLDGEKAAIEFIKRWKPHELIYRVMREFSKRLVDASEFDVLERMSLYGKDCPGLVIAINHELFEVGRTAAKVSLTRTLNQIVGPGKWLDKANDIFDRHQISTSAYLSLFEACIMRKLPVANIRRALNHYIDEPRLHTINENYYSEHRTNFLRNIAIHACIKSDYHFSVSDIMPKSWRKEPKNQRNNEDIKNGQEVIEALLPWYMVRAKILAKEKLSIEACHEQATKISSQLLNARYREYDPLPSEISDARFFNLLLVNDNVDSEIENLIEGMRSGRVTFNHSNRLRALRIAYRADHLNSLADFLEESCYETLQIIDEDEGPLENAHGFISLSRAALASSQADAEVYFEKAIEAVSRFGDEAVERWEAVVNIARHGASFGSKGQEQAYRFMRCAELIGRTVAREKHWDRDEAMATSFHLSPTSSFAIASRWNDRFVGRRGRMLAALLKEALDSNTISPSSAWALSALPFDYDLVGFARFCISKETNVEKQQIVLNDLIESYRHCGITGAQWKAIDNLAREHNLHHETLEQLELLSRTEPGEETSISKDPTPNRRYPEVSCEKLYGDLDFVSEDGLREALDRFHALDAPRDFEALWRYAASTIPNKHAVAYLTLVANTEFLDIHDIRTALRCFPESLKKKPGVQKAWASIVKIIAERYPHDFIQCFHRNWALKDIGTDEVTRGAVREGVLKSLSETNELASASTFYGFAGSCATELGMKEADELLNYALSRFELHIDDKFADGPWSTELLPPDDVTSSLTGYVWACLGSPESSQRWCAAHTVRRLYRLSCQHEIDSLLAWLGNSEIKPFIGRGNPFYFLHAKQYLLVALARCAKDNPDLLKKHSETFCNIALYEEGHILIQMLAADIAVAIYKAEPKIYASNIVDQLKQVGKTPFPIETPDNYYDSRDTLWHQKGTVDTSQDLCLSYDFDRYWFDPLGDVFKVPSKQVQDLAKEVIQKDWQLYFSERYISDPRQEIWNQLRDRSTWHSHSSYPRTDDYSFYLSYHAMMVVAGKLLSTSPIIYSRDWHDDQWQDWLDRHLPNREDGSWLSDRRDFFPLKRRRWWSDQTDTDWRWQILGDDFLEILLSDQQQETWLNVAGSWNEYRSGHNESIYVSSRLVPEWSSASLQRAITFHRSDLPGGLSLAHFDDRYSNGDKNHPFQLTSWYTDGNSDERLDHFDPYAGALDYPPIIVDQEIAALCKLAPDSEYRYWRDSTTQKRMLCSLLWSEDKPIYDDNEYCSKGKCLQASLTSLKNLLSALRMDLVVEIEIRRQLVGIYRNNDDAGYTLPYRKVYILSKDGRLRDTKTSLKLRSQVTE